MNRLRSTILLASLVVVGCKKNAPEINMAQEQIDAIQQQVAPDKRVALFDIVAEKGVDNSYVLTGETDKKVGLQALKEALEAKNISFVDSVVLLPSKALGDSTSAIVTLSVANLRSAPKHSAELATQATLGTPVNVLKKEGGWYYIQTPDKYLAWVDSGAIQLVAPQQKETWEDAAKIIYTQTYGHAYSNRDKKDVVSDLVAGNVLELVAKENAFYTAKFPDGRVGFVAQDEAEEYNSWLAKLENTSSALVATSKRFLGVPYLWGGTSTKGMDCSGFTKTIFFLNGIVIPRDASQQVHTGKAIDNSGNFDNLEAGDLLFFGRKATDTTQEKVVHVGMWLGNNEFIHASDMVRVSSVDKTAKNYDAYNLDRYLRTKRVLKAQDKDLIYLKQVPLFN